MLAASLPTFTKVKKDAWGPVYAVAGVERRPDQSKQPCIFLTPLRNRLSKPLVVATASNPKNSAHYLDAVLLLMRLDEPVGLPDSASASLGGHGGLLSGKACSPSLSTKSWELQKRSSATADLLAISIS
jgi:hypothetical protein